MSERQCYACYGVNDRTCMKPKGHKGKHGSGRKKRKPSAAQLIAEILLTRKLADLEFENAILRARQRDGIFQP